MISLRRSCDSNFYIPCSSQNREKYGRTDPKSDGICYPKNSIDLTSSIPDSDMSALVCD